LDLEGVVIVVFFIGKAVLTVFNVDVVAKVVKVSDVEVVGNVVIDASDALFLFEFSNNGCEDFFSSFVVGVGLNDIGVNDVVVVVGFKDIVVVVVIGVIDMVGVVLSVESFILWIAFNDSMFSVDFNDVVVVGGGGGGGGVGFNDVFAVVLSDVANVGFNDVFGVVLSVIL
jgi:hypothetical protein